MCLPPWRNPHTRLKEQCDLDKLNGWTEGQQAGGQLGQKYGDRTESHMGSDVTRNLCIPLWTELLPATNPRSQSRDLPYERATRPLSSCHGELRTEPVCFGGPRPATGHRPCSASAARPRTPVLPASLTRALPAAQEGFRPRGLCRS